MTQKAALTHRMPDFIIIGAGKSGTSSVYEYLNEHPEVHMSPVKETNYFALQGQEIGISPQKDPEQQFHYPWSITQLTDYQALFANAKQNQQCGEASPMYLYNDEAPLRIKETIPQTKLIVILRQPVERLYSRFMHLAREKREPSEHFSDALERDSIWWRRNDLVQEGFYYTHLKRYFELFPESQLKVFLYEDLRQNPEAMMQELFSFIGVENSFKPQLGMEYNVSGKIKNPMIDALIGQQSVLKQAVEKASPALAESLKKSSLIKAATLKLRKKNLVKAPLSAALKQEMTDKIYRKEILALQSLIQRDLNHWL